MANLPPSEHPPFKSERDALIQIAKTWPGHHGVNFETTTSKNIYLLIMDALKGIPATPARDRAPAGDQKQRHLDVVGRDGCRAATETTFYEDH